MFSSKRTDYIRLEDSNANHSTLSQTYSSNNSIIHRSSVGSEFDDRLLTPNYKGQYLSSPYSSNRKSRQELSKIQLFDTKYANDDTCTSSFISSSQFPEQYSGITISCFQKVKGLLIMLVGVILFDLARFTIKLCYALNAEITPMEQSVIRISFMLTFITLFISCSCQIRSVLCKIPRRLKCLLVARSIIGGLYAIFMGCALLQLTYSTAVTLSFTAPLLAPLAAYFVLKEKIKVCDIVALLISFGGVLIFTNPQIFESQEEGKIVNKDNRANMRDEENHLIGFVFIILAATCRAIDISLLKKLTSKDDTEESSAIDRYGRIIGSNRVVNTKNNEQFRIHIQQFPRLQEQSEESLLRSNTKVINTLTPVFYMTLSGTLLSIIGFEGDQISKNESMITGLIDKINLSVIVCLSISAIFTLLAQYFYSIATKHQSASRLAGVFYFQIITAFLFEVFVFHGNIGIAEVMGTSIILASSVSVAIFKILYGSSSSSSSSRSNIAK